MLYENDRGVSIGVSESGDPTEGALVLIQDNRVKSATCIAVPAAESARMAERLMEIAGAHTDDYDPPLGDVTQHAVNTDLNAALYYLKRANRIAAELAKQPKVSEGQIVSVRDATFRARRLAPEGADVSRGLAEELVKAGWVPPEGDA